MKHPRRYKSAPRFTPPAAKITEKGVRAMADRRGYRLRVQPGRPGLWRLEDRETGRIVRSWRSLKYLRGWLTQKKTLDHKARERQYRRRLPVHPWAAVA